MTQVQLFGRVIVTGRIRALTGLHIGGSPGALAIGNVDMPVIRDAVTGRPYIPGSSLKGKMRSLAEKITGAPQNKSIGRDVTIHVAGGDRRDYDRGEEGEKEYRRVGLEQYHAYWVNPLFGVPGEVDFDVPAPNRLIVRDVPLWDEEQTELKGVRGKSVQDLLKIQTDLPFTEVKWEAAIDRVTSAATPRQMERVPADAVFAPMELVFSIYLPSDIELFGHLLTSLQLVEDDYLGGQGSRGSGKVVFEGLTLTCKRGDTYEEDPERPFTDQMLSRLIADKSQVLDWLSRTIPTA
ncbi:MAG: type III-A CRISPR-associated RAMP protein Csm3 [Chloroflexota bacterium]